MDDARPVSQSQLQEALAAQKEEITREILAAIHQTETALLKAFFAYQEHAQVRMRKISADVSNINAAAELRMNNLEQRVIEIEKKLLLEPPAA